MLGFCGLGFRVFCGLGGFRAFCGLGWKFLENFGSQAGCMEVASYPAASAHALVQST